MEDDGGKLVDDELVNEIYTLPKDTNYLYIAINLKAIPVSKGDDLLEGSQQELFVDVEVLETHKQTKTGTLNVDSSAFKPDPVDTTNKVVKIWESIFGKDKKEKKKNVENTNAIECYCLSQGLVEKSCKSDGRLILENDYNETAKRLDIEPEVMKAIAKQESKRNSFWQKGQATILFERHKMWKCLENAGRTNDELKELKENNPKIVNKSAGEYGTYADQYEKLITAKEINYTCAIKSCSWGKFQVMGFNYAVAFSSPEEMEKAVNICEYQQFKFFIGYLENTNGMLEAIKNKDWEDIAKKYNGSAWKTTNPDYATNLKKYYDELK